MQVLTTITPKFQVHIPVSIRKQAGLVKHGRAYVNVSAGRIIIEPMEDNFLSLAGTFHIKNPTKAEQIREVIEYSDKK